MRRAWPGLSAASGQGTARVACPWNHKDAATLHPLSDNSAATPGSTSRPALSQSTQSSLPPREIAAQKPSARAGGLGRAGRRRSVSRVLSRVRVTPGAEAIIPLGRRLPAASSGLPAGSGEQPYHPRGRRNRPRETPAYAALLPMGFAVPPALPRARWALTPPFHPYRRPAKKSGVDGGLFSVALSSTFLPPGVTRHRALWSSDFPPAAPERGQRSPERRRRRQSALRATAPQLLRGPGGRDPSEAPPRTRTASPPLGLPSGKFVG